MSQPVYLTTPPPTSQAKRAGSLYLVYFGIFFGACFPPLILVFLMVGIIYFLTCRRRQNRVNTELNRAWQAASAPVQFDTEARARIATKGW